MPPKKKALENQEKTDVSPNAGILTSLENERNLKSKNESSENGPKKSVAKKSSAKSEESNSNQTNPVSQSGNVTHNQKSVKKNESSKSEQLKSNQKESENATHKPVAKKSNSKSEQPNSNQKESENEALKPVAKKTSSKSDQSNSSQTNSVAQSGNEALKPVEKKASSKSEQSSSNQNSSVTESENVTQEAGEKNEELSNSKEEEDVVKFDYNEPHSVIDKKKSEIRGARMVKIMKNFENSQYNKMFERNSYCYFFLHPFEWYGKEGKDQRNITIDEFRKQIFYVGKGTGDRSASHITELRTEEKKLSKIQDKEERDKVTSDKMKVVLEYWNKDENFFVVKVFKGILEIQSKYRESVMIKAIGLNNLTNKKNGLEINDFSLEIQKEYGEFMFKRAFKDAQTAWWKPEFKLSSSDREKKYNLRSNAQNNEEIS